MLPVGLSVHKWPAEIQWPTDAIFPICAALFQISSTDKGRGREAQKAGVVGKGLSEDI